MAEYRADQVRLSTFFHQSVRLETAFRKELLKQMMSSIPQSVLITVSCPQCNILKCVLNMNTGSKVRDIFKNMKQRRLFRRASTLSAKDFLYFHESVTLWAEDKSVPIKFSRELMDTGMSLAGCANALIVMVKKEYQDDELEDESLLKRNTDKVAVIKSYDISMPAARGASLREKLDGYRSKTSAKIYEVFEATLVESRKSKRECLLGIDEKYVYLLDPAGQKGFPDKVFTTIPKKILPSFEISDINNFGLKDKFLRITVTNHRDLKNDLIVIESPEVGQIYGKLDILINCCNNQDLSLS